MSRQIVIGFIVVSRVIGQHRVFEGLAFLLILLTPWWLWQSQDASSLKPLKAVLGKQRYSEPRLSRDNTVSCASRHTLDHSGASGASEIRGRDGASSTIDMLTVFNRGLQCLSITSHALTATILQLAAEERFIASCDA
jgi:hypothetical protein